jgi:hypothetical protein
LWLSIVLAAVLVFVMSSLIHMVFAWHRSDWSKLPSEDAALEALHKTGVTPGNYVFPHSKGPKEWSEPAMAAKLERGPVGFMTIMPSGMPRMGAQLAQWFVYTLLVGVVVAYLTGRTVAPGAEYLQVFRVAGTTAFLTYAGAEPLHAIWFKRSWGSTLKHMFDGLLYALLTAGAFAGFWPA